MDNIYSHDINFEPGKYVEIYFEEEKIRYRLTISDRKFECYPDTIVVNLPLELKNTFYKGEDFLQCKYVDNNIVYDFWGEIIRIVVDNNPCIIIKRPIHIQKENSRSKARLSVNTLAEYTITNKSVGAIDIRNFGFCTIKDVNIDGVSLLTTEIIPVNSILKIDVLKANLSFVIEIKQNQIENNKYLYGGKILEFISPVNVFNDFFLLEAKQKQLADEQQNNLYY